MMQEFSLKSWLGKGLFFTVLRVSVMAMSSFGSLWMLRQLGPEKIGISSWVLAAMAPAALFTQFALSPLVIREYKESTSPAEYCGRILAQRFFTALVWSIAGGFLVCCSQPQYRLAILAGVILFVCQQTTPVWVFQAENRMGEFFKYSLVPQLLVSASYFLIIRKGDPAGTDVAIQGAVSLAAVPWMWYGLRKAGLAPKFNFQIKDLLTFCRQLLVRGRWMFLSGLTVYAYTVLEQPLLGWLSGTENLGKYRSALMISTLVSAILGIYQQMLFPRFIIWRQESPAKLWCELLKLFRISLLILVPLSCVGGVLLMILFPVVFGEKYQAAAVPALLLAVSQVVIFVNGLFGWGLWADAGNDRLMATIMAAVAVVSIVMNIALIPIFGLVGASSVNLLSEFLILISTFFFCYRRYHVRHVASR